MLANDRFRKTTGMAIAIFVSVSLTTLGAANASAEELSGDVAAAVAAHEATLARIETLHLKAAARTAQFGGELKLYQETEWWRSGDHERFADVLLLNTVTGDKYDPALREETGFDAQETRSVDLWNSDDVRKTPLLPRGQEKMAFARARGTIMPAAKGFRRHALQMQLLLQPGGKSLREYLEEATEAKVLSRTEDAVILETARPTYRELLELSPKQGHLIRRAEWQAKDVPLDQAVVIEIEFEESNGVAFPAKATTRRGEGDVLLDVVVSDLQINEPLDPSRATVRFPEGGAVSRLDDAKEIEWYVWGKGEPRLTFESREAYNAWLKDAMAGASED